MLTEAMDYMRERGTAVFVSIAAGREAGAERIVRDSTRRVCKDIALRQRRAGIRPTMVTVFEALGRDRLPKFGAHVVALMPNAASRDRLTDSITGSKAYKAKAYDVDAKAVKTWDDVTTYLLKEATPQAAYRRDFRRVGGSIPLGELGGDRVILSKALKAALIDTGKIQPYRRTYAKRQGKAAMPITVEAVAIETMIDEAA